MDSVTRARESKEDITEDGVETAFDVIFVDLASTVRNWDVLPKSFIFYGQTSIGGWGVNA